MGNMTCTQPWVVDGSPANASGGATIGIYDNTTATQVVASGTAMTNPSTGLYQYIYTGAIAGHTYTVTFSVTYSPAIGDTATFTRSIVNYYSVQSSIPGTPGSTPAITSTASMVPIYQQQLADVTNAKTAALAAISAVLANNMGPSYSVGGSVGSESLSMNEFLTGMRDSVKTYVDLEKMLLETLQDLQPFDLRQRVRVWQRW